MTTTRLFLFLSLIASSTMASTIFSTFGPGNSFNTIADGSGSYDVGGGAFNGNIEDEQASSFVPTQSFVLNFVSVAAYYVEGSNQLTVSIASGATEPGVVLESFSVAGLSTTPTILTLDSTLHPLLTDGTRYWVVLSKTDLAGGAEEWNLNSEGFLGRSNMLLQSGVWQDHPNAPAPAFAVSGNAVPEPGSIWFVLTAIGPFAYAICRRRVVGPVVTRAGDPGSPSF